MVCAGAYAPAHTIFAIPFYEGLSRWAQIHYEVEKWFHPFEN